MSKQNRGVFSCVYVYIKRSNMTQTDIEKQEAAEEGCTALLLKSVS